MSLLGKSSVPIHFHFIELKVNDYASSIKQLTIHFIGYVNIHMLQYYSLAPRQTVQQAWAMEHPQVIALMYQ